MTNKTLKSRAEVIAPFLIEFVIDETGSMDLCKEATINGFNQYISDQRNNSGQCKLSLSKFEGGNIKTPYEDLDINFVPFMSSTTFVPGGCTNLYDAIGNRMLSLSSRLQNWIIRPNVLFIVMTDGRDNMSHSYNAVSISKLLQTRRDDWGFAYLGSDSAALDIGRSMGFLDSEIKVYSASNTQQTWGILSKSTTAYRAGVSAGNKTAIFNQE